MTSCASLVFGGDGTGVVWSRQLSSNRGRRPPMFKKKKKKKSIKQTKNNNNKPIAECLPVLQADLLADVRPPIPVTDHLARERTRW